jgi:uroporphyrinogen decarboxylase
LPEPDAGPVAATAGGEAGTAPLFIRACRREPVERTPVWIMRQAGRYLPEYRALREKHDFLTSCHTPELAAEITLQPVRRLGVDAAILFSDILIPLPAMGVPVEFNPGPQIDNPVRSAADVAALTVPDAREATPYVMEAIRLLRRELPPEVPLIGFAGAPFTVATYLVEGGGSKSFAALRQLLFGEPAVAHKLLEKCADTLSSYLVEQARAGAQAAMLFDTWAGLLSPEDYSRFAAPAAKRVLESVAAAAPEIPLIYYAGEGAGRLERCRDLGAHVIGVDWRVGLDEARRRLGPDLAVQGNLDPGVLLGPPELIRERAGAVLAQARGDSETDGPARGHIFNLGHGILPGTPPEHAQHLVDAVRELSARREA